MVTVALEGSSFSGKTTLSRQLANHFGAPIINEYIDYALRVRADGFPPFAASEEELNRQIDFYAGLEAERKQDLLSSSSPITIVDRTIASLIVFQRVQQRRANVGEYWGPEKMAHYLQIKQTLGQVIVPQLVLVLSAGSKQEHDARVQKRGTIQIEHLRSLNEWSFSEDLRRRTIDTLDNIFPLVPVIEHVTSADPRSFAEIVNTIENVMEVEDDQVAVS